MNKFFKRLSLSQRLSIPVMSFIILVFIGFQFITYQRFLKIERENLLSHTQVLANGVGMNLTAAVLFNDHIDGTELLSAFKADPLIARVRLEHLDHSLFAQYINADIEFISPTSKQQHDVSVQSYHFGREMLYLMVPIMMDGEPIAHMHIAVSLKTLQQMRITHFKISILLLITLCAITAYIINRVQSWVTQPITQLNNAVNRIIKDENPSPIRSQIQTSHEVGELVNGFNSMQKKLNERDAKIQATLNQLGEEKAFADDVIETVQHALVVVNQQGKITLANDACLYVLGLPAATAQGLSLSDVLHTEQPDTFRQQLDQVLNGQKQFDHALMKSAISTGQSRTYEIISRPLEHRRQTLFAIEDVTKKQHAERQQQMAAKVFDCSQDAIMLLSGSGKITMVNPAFSKYLGYNADDVIGKHFHQLLDLTKYSKLQRSIQQALKKTNHWQGEMNQLCKDGTYIPLFVRINRIQDSHRSEVQTVVIASDLRSMKKMRRLEHLATHDPLTNLANRSKLRQELRQLLTKRQTASAVFAVLFIDLDDFKTVNDSYGHSSGDKVLQIIAERLIRTVRKSDIVARLAGDEFVTIINPVSNQDDITFTCERILARIMEPISLRKKIQLNIGASIGCYYVFANESLDVDDILRRADKAMYSAKLSGKGQIIEFNQFRHD
ncbi:diguanylate cyclase domain-containing protein [Photobacterium chitinilyticum]|uniref:Diguanylate cyclase n=1 Tax=Photobacterium chitinilyticum TaxID=2485123 RepID=A0A444JV86_9GAMM|nr:diguanylate cyclase [Photobacterium chitinilyticum]RWX56973.1 diguanylate cyclase [Photobacterium chitinilyticum]